MIRPGGNYVLIRPLDSVGESRELMTASISSGVVIELGPGVPLFHPSDFEDGNIPEDYDIDDIVYYRIYDAIAVVDKEKVYHFVRDKDIIGWKDNEDFASSSIEEQVQHAH